MDESSGAAAGAVDSAAEDTVEVRIDDDADAQAVGTPYHAMGVPGIVHRKRRRIGVHIRLRCCNSGCWGALAGKVVLHFVKQSTKKCLGCCAKREYDAVWSPAESFQEIQVSGLMIKVFQLQKPLEREQLCDCLDSALFDSMPLTTSCGLNSTGSFSSIHACRL